jgi:hypothetical protein
VAENLLKLEVQSRCQYLVAVCVWAGGLGQLQFERWEVTTIRGPQCYEPKVTGRSRHYRACANVALRTATHQCFMTLAFASMSL